jgi:hypothetical protein
VRTLNRLFTSSTTCESDQGVRISRQPFTKPPQYCLHRGSGQAVVYLQGRPRYLGKYQSPESHETYARIIAEWTRRSLADEQTVPLESISVNHLLVGYFGNTKSNYVDAVGKQTSEYQSMLYAAQPLRKLYGRTLAPVDHTT